MALLTYEIRGLGDVAADRREEIRQAMAAGDPRNSAVTAAVMRSYAQQTAVFPSLPGAGPGAGGIPTWVKWVAGGLGVAALLGIGVAVLRRRKAS